MTRERPDPQKSPWWTTRASAPSSAGALEGFEVGRHRRRHGGDFLSALNLKTVGPVVAKALDVELAIEIGDELGRERDSPARTFLDAGRPEGWPDPERLPQGAHAGSPGAVGAPLSAPSEASARSRVCSSHDSASAVIARKRIPRPGGRSLSPAMWAWQTNPLKSRAL